MLRFDYYKIQNVYAFFEFRGGKTTKYFQRALTRTHWKVKPEKMVKPNQSHAGFS